jgi:hypothetical protein
MKPKHTPGPWISEPRNELAVNLGNETFYVTAKELPHTLAMVNDEANARLIAAAPDLLEALEVALEYMEQVVRLDPTKSAAKNQIKWIETAIRKAKGE